MHFRTPLGVYPLPGESRPAHEPQRGYRLTRYADHSSPWYFEILLPVPELFEVFRSMCEHLPPLVYPVLERPPEPDEDLPAWPEGRYVSLGRYMPRRDILKHFQEHAFQIQNDGMLGAGIAGRTDDGIFREVFIEEHKTLRVITEDADEIKAILDEGSIPFVPDLMLLNECTHAHRSLIALTDLHDLFPEGELAYDLVFSEMARALGMPNHPNRSL